MREICTLRSTWRGMEPSYGSVIEALPDGAIPRPYQLEGPLTLG